MPPRTKSQQRGTEPASLSVDADVALVVRLLAGDAGALNVLIDRYDRLVRYVIYKASRRQCQSDPYWLDSVASDSWAGFVQSIRRDPAHPPANVRSYLVRIAHHRCVSALRSAKSQRQQFFESDNEGDWDPGLPATADDPAETLADLEDLEALRSCMGHLSSDDARLCSELEAIADRRWTDAAAALELSESTLRSRWKRVLAFLRDCVSGKTGRSVAPGDRNRDA